MGHSVSPALYSGPAPPALSGLHLKAECGSETGAGPALSLSLHTALSTGSLAKCWEGNPGPGSHSASWQIGETQEPFPCWLGSPTL